MVGRVGWGNCVKEKGEKNDKNCVGKVVCKSRLKNQVDKIGGKVMSKKCYGTTELTIVLNIWMTNLGNKFNVIFFGTNQL